MRIIPLLLHHSEPADPTLLRWIRDTVDHVLGGVLGLGPGPIVLILGVLIVAFPVALITWVTLSRRRQVRGRPH